MTPDNKNMSLIISNVRPVPRQHIRTCTLSHSLTLSPTNSLTHTLTHPRRCQGWWLWTTQPWLSSSVALSVSTTSYGREMPSWSSTDESQCSLTASKSSIVRGTYSLIVLWHSTPEEHSERFVIIKWTVIVIKRHNKSHRLHLREFVSLYLRHVMHHTHAA